MLQRSILSLSVCVSLGAPVFGQAIQQIDRDGQSVTTLIRSVPVDGPRGGNNFLVNGNFTNGLNGWDAKEIGGSGAPGSAEAIGGRAILREGDSFLVTISQNVTVPLDAFIRFEWADVPGFDLSDDFLADAFEASLLTPANDPLVEPWDPGATSFFNVQEDGTIFTGPTVSMNGRTVTVDANGAAPGSQAILYFDLIGADNDTGGGVTVDDVRLTEGPPITCLWDQGGWDGVEGQSSESGSSIEDSRTADEFCLKTGYVHEIETFFVEMLTDSTAPDATLRLYHDCNGCPGELVDCGFFAEPTVTVLETDVLGELDLVQFRFNAQLREEIDEYGDIVTKPATWLKGGCYWLSPVGIGDGTGYDRYFWATSGDDLLGAIPKTQVGELKVGPDFWELVSNVNVGCRNFAFTVSGESCCIVQDDSMASTDTGGAIDTTSAGCRNADNFFVPPCAEAESVCYLSAYIWTNCECERTKVEFFGDECVSIVEPSGGRTVRRGPIENSSSGEFTASKCVQITGFGPNEGGITFEGYDLALYRVEFHDVDYPVRAGENLWAVLHVQGTGAFNERGFWAFAEDCRNPDCVIDISSGQSLCPQDGVLEYTEVGRDFALCVAIRESDEIITNTDTSAESGCVVDMDGDGEADIDDLISFLGQWFQGCPE